MNIFTDLVLSTQITTALAAIATYVASNIQAENWMFMVPVLLLSATGCMLFPYLVIDGVQRREQR